MRLLYIGPTNREATLQSYASPGVSVEARFNAGGPGTIESMHDEYLYIPSMLDMIVQAEREGFDAVVVGCFGDPGIDAARELVRIPVIGVGESSMLLAAQLGFSFSIITVLDSVIRPLKILAGRVGIAAKLASVREVTVRVAEAGDDPEATYARLLACGRQCLSQDDADALILGCGTLSFLYADRLQADLGVPVLNALRVGIRTAELLVGANVTHSARAYPTPPKVVGRELAGVS